MTSLNWGLPRRERIHLADQALASLALVERARRRPGSRFSQAWPARLLRGLCARRGLELLAGPVHGTVAGQGRAPGRAANDAEHEHEPHEVQYPLPHV